MNRFLGPSGFYYGIKPDRRLRKEHLLRYFRRRFPHLALFLHPAYFEPWLSLQHAPTALLQPPYFAPGLRFPFVMLRGTAHQKARRIRYPYGVFRLRSWRFEPPLYNLPMTRRIRQQRFRNVFKQKHFDPHRTTSNARLAAALGHQAAIVNSAVDARDGEKSASPNFVAEKNKHDSVGSSDGTGDTLPEDHQPSSATPRTATKVRSGKVQTAAKNKSAKHLRTSPSSGTPSDSENRSEKSGEAQTIDYPALVEIARRKKRELKKQRQAAQETRKREATEQAYMKNLLDKARRRPSSSGSSKPSHSSGSKPEIKHGHQEKEREARPLRKRDAERTEFPFANVPPGFHKTPAAGRRFYWSEAGPELRNEKNKNLPNVMRKRHEDLAVADEEPAEYEYRDDSTEYSSGTMDSGKTTRTTHSKTANSSNSSGKKKELNVAFADRSQTLLVPSKTQFFESTASLARSTKSGTKINPVSPKVSGSTVAKKPKRKSRRKRCRVDADTLKAERELRLRLANLNEKSPLDFLVYREDLMKLRETAWNQMQKRNKIRQQKRRLKAATDAKKREEKVKQGISPVSVKRSPVKQYLSIGKFSDQASTASKPSSKSLPTETQEAPPVNPYFPKAKNRREAFRAYVAKHLLRIKADLVYRHRAVHAATPRTDPWGRLQRRDIPLFDNKNPYLVKIIRKLMRTKMGFRYKWESRAEEFLTNFPFVELQTYRKFPMEGGDAEYRERLYQRIKKIYRGQRIFKMMTPLRWYKTVSKNAVERPFDFQLYSDAVDEFRVLADAQKEREAAGDSLKQTFQDIGVYEVLCLHLRTPPFPDFQTQLAAVNAGNSSVINLEGKNLTDSQVRPIAMCVMLSQLVDHFNVSNNLLSPQGARYVAGVCGHTENVSELNATGTQFDVDACEVLYSCLRRPYCKIRKLWLRNCGLGSECAQLVARIVMENRSVFVLDLGENHLSSVGSNDMIALAIAENTVLQYLDLSYNGFSEKASYLIFMGLKSNSFIRTFLFGHNHVANKGCDGVYDALRNSETLWRVDLEHCAIVDKGAQAVANGITKNDSLKSLNLANNPIGVPGTTALLKAISNKEKLKSVDVSNCTVNAAFVTSAAALESQKELRIKHTGEGVPNKALPPYPIDLDALAAKAGKKKDNKTKK